MSPSQNSITRHIDEHSIATRVRQLRSEHNRAYQRPITIVIVEGDIDSLFYQSLFDISHCHIEPAYRKNNAIRALGILKHDNFQGVIAIVDDDFDKLNGTVIQENNLVATDAHDLENLIIASNALDKMLLFVLPTEKRRFHSNFVGELRKKMILLCLPLGYLRWLLYNQNPPIDFSQINFRNFIDKRNMRINIPLAVKEVLSKNHDCKKSEGDIYSELQNVVATRKDDWWYVCQGHDLVKILCLILPRILYTYAPNTKEERDVFFNGLIPIIGNEANITKHLAMCYEKVDFEKTSMHAQIRRWENKNQPYLVLQN
jgi:hypothetical protein